MKLSTDQYGVGNLVGFRRGQFVGHARGECVADVEVRFAAVDIRLRDGTRRTEVVRKRIGRCNINRVGHVYDTDACKPRTTTAATIRAYPDPTILTIPSKVVQSETY
jgi:hypothetical protein